MVEYLHGVHGAVPIIIDNDSTYPPLLEWYESCGVEVIRLQENRGSQAAWNLPGDLARGDRYYVVTDSDLDLSNVPADVLLHLQSGLVQYPTRMKAGLSLEIADLPPVSDLSVKVAAWERKFWQRRMNSQWWDGAIDTTFAMYRSGTGWGSTDPWTAIRADRPYTARHIPWYAPTDEEELYYKQHANPDSTFWMQKYKEVA
jgi:hypothetical protein